jgi:hypothetical protein
MLHRMPGPDYSDDFLIYRFKSHRWSWLKWYALAWIKKAGVNFITPAFSPAVF